MAVTVKHTERTMLDLLVQGRYGSRYYHGNGDRYVCAEHVNNGAGFSYTRTADLIVQDVWPSKGLELIGHEVKVSRSDWLTELKDPDKSAAFRRFCDRWWLVVPDAKIVRDDLPDGWGLMAICGDQLRAVRPAPRLVPEPLPRSMQAALLRATAKTAARIGYLSAQVGRAS